ncbi:polysaccharide deacetylase family protein [Nocardioides hwasunensis]|uniref:Polysaccharide deacetylase family protein n=1 Tax=Nocardioides hwasunensis TaxID=397258 RepID=A0ABR8MH41_9ACTN|nr:polysaccharide deacetylase family protein [Nocardioides hwasunensis]MBD3915228.1 polysaccharide deacetylase family protein [Nocardioides hwasunensis]
MSMGARTRINVCFHGIGTPARVLETGEAPYWIDHRTYLDVLDAVAEDPRVRISFDDGNSSDIELGLPGLLERGLTATFFVLAGRLDRPGSLGTSDVQALRQAGMTIGTHGMDHRPWRGLDAGHRRRELEEARQVLARIAGTPVTEAALPLGRYDRELLGHLRALGYTAVHTSDRRWAREGSWLQPRFSVRDGDTAETVRTTMLGRQSPARLAERVLVGTVKRLR